MLALRRSEIRKCKTNIILVNIPICQIPKTLERSFKFYINCKLLNLPESDPCIYITSSLLPYKLKWAVTRRNSTDTA